MIALVQRVENSSVVVGDKVVGAIGAGLNVLLGVAAGDSEADADYLAAKVANLRIFEDQHGKMNLSLRDTGGQMLVVSQFTLLGDCRKGRRPSFVNAAQPVLAEKCYQRFIQQVRTLGVDTQTGQFGAMMQVTLVNDGPVTLIVHSQ